MSDVHPLRVLAKALIFFLALNLIFAVLNPPVGRLSIYNWLVKGRQRFPTDQDPGTFRLSTNDLDALFASHVISNAVKPPREYRVIILGDSQTWGWTATLSETLVGQLNAAELSLCGKHLRFYNLGYPVSSVLRDFLFLNKALAYKPDLVIWMVTTNSFVLSRWPIGWSPFMFSTDPKGVSELLDQYGLGRYSNLTGPVPTYWERTLIGQRTALSKLTFLQIYGLRWAGTGIDNVNTHPAFDKEVSSNLNYLDFAPPKLPASIMAWDVLEGARKMLGGTPVLLVNEPIYIGPGESAGFRYNKTYPRWAYDQYRHLLPGYSAELGWHYVDLYNAVPYTKFADQDLHLKTKGEKILMKSLLPEILRVECP
jgi:hypothetical protein